MCGLTTGGVEECWWDCDFKRVQRFMSPGEFEIFIDNPTCLADCLPQCVSSLLADYQSAGGTCTGSCGAYPGVYPVSDQCEFDDDGFLTKGLCSDTTQTLLSDPQNCINPIFNLTERIFDSVRCLVNSMCDRETWQNLEPVPITKRVPAMKLLKDNQEDRTTAPN